MQLSEKILKIITEAKQSVAKTANTAMVYSYFHIGKLIVEEMQEGNLRAEYGSQLLIQVAAELTQKMGRGFSVQNLERMRMFFLVYSKSSNELRNSEVFEKSSNELRILDCPII